MFIFFGPSMINQFFLIQNIPVLHAYWGGGGCIKIF
jgi:hypothetical protein